MLDYSYSKTKGADMKSLLIVILLTLASVAARADVHLPDGATVEVTPLELTPESDPFLQAVDKVAKPRPHWPKDYALNHGHYVSGEPRKP